MNTTTHLALAIQAMKVVGVTELQQLTWVQTEERTSLYILVSSGSLNFALQWEDEGRTPRNSSGKDLYGFKLLTLQNNCTRIVLPCSTWGH